MENGTIKRIRTTCKKIPLWKSIVFVMALKQSVTCYQYKIEMCVVTRPLTCWKVDSGFWFLIKENNYFYQAISLGLLLSCYTVCFSNHLKRSTVNKVANSQQKSVNSRQLVANQLKSFQIVMVFFFFFFWGP